jgi:hypothetical protein
MAISHKIGDILFSDIKTNRKSFVPLNNGEIFQYDTDALNEDYGVGGALPFFINAVEIDWNGAQLKNGSTVKATLNTTGEMLSILQTA